MNLLRVLPVALIVAAAVGCNSSAGDPIEPIPGSAGECAPGYPAGAKGGNVGDLIDCFCWDGYAQPGLGIGGEPDRVCLHDLYNPDALAVHDDTSPFEEGTNKPLVIMLSIGAVWCQPCKEEAATVLPAVYSEREPLGFELISILTDAEDAGTPAEFSHLDAWVSAFESKYPSVIDPDLVVGQIVDTTNYPANLLIDARDMTIFDKVIGKPQEAFFTQTDDRLLAPGE